ncbi:TetR/AcrR family transcriptional regulator C-terminal domain-containing protein [Streptosporangium sp. CA-135522]|uniref:TetR/AcrR family transcriptional regulator C-terminal domain-containing protein n=1 Tax=Streptosporangium sp. CA-135522 TaxID=3240072 RepID=UPI003D8AC74D
MNQHLSSVWTRESRPAKSPGLSRDQIVRAAMGLLDAEGLDALSMRRLGARLGSGATSIYWHVANKDELLELVMDEVLGEVPLPDPDVVGWRDAASVFAYGLRTALFAHPWAASLIGARAALGPNAVEMSARLLRTFTLAGFKGLEQDYASSALMSYVLGATTPELTWRRMTNDGEMNGQELLAALRPMVEQAARDHPELAARYSEYYGAEVDIETVRLLCFDFGLTCFLDGLQERLRQAAMEPGATRFGTEIPHEARNSEI